MESTELGARPIDGATAEKPLQRTFQTLAFDSKPKPHRFNCELIFFYYFF